MGYLYFVSYITFEETRWGFGNMELAIDKKVDGIEGVRKLEELIKNIIDGDENTSIVILNYKVLRRI